MAASWQQFGQFTQMELSNNRLSGTLSDSFNIGSNTTQIDLTVNRLSGDIPGAFFSAESVSILQGNLFQCEADNKPEHDPSSAEYVCGSSDLDDSLIVWGALALLVSLVLAMTCGPQLLKLSARQTDSLSLLGAHCAEFLSILRRITICCCLLTAAMVLVVMLSFIAIKSDAAASSLYSTHTEQYTWVTTAAYMHGLLPASLVCIFVVGGTFVILKMVSSGSISQSKSEHQKPAAVDIIKLARSMLFVSVHMVVMVTINAFYVLAVNGQLSPTKSLVLSGGVGAFKLLWSELYVDWLGGRLALTALTMEFMKLFTFLVSPVVATFFSDPTCFLYVTQREPAVVSSFYTDSFSCGTDCAELNCHSVCGMTSLTDNQINTSVSPGWLYSYQCSSALLVNYIPVLVFAFTISGLIEPAVRCLYLQLSVAQVERLVPSVIREKLAHSINLHQLPAQVSSPTAAGSAIVVKPVFSSAQVISQLFVSVAVLMTFGLACPLLAVIITVDVVNVLFSWRMLIHRFVSMHQPHQYQHQDNDTDRSSRSSLSVDRVNEACVRLEQATEGAGAWVNSGVLQVLVVVCLFWSIFLLDMVGDVYGELKGGLSVLVLLVAMASSFALHTGWEMYQRRRLAGETNIKAGSVSVDGIVLAERVSKMLRTTSSQRVVAVVLSPLEHPQTDVNEDF